MLKSPRDTVSPPPVFITTNYRFLVNIVGVSLRQKREHITTMCLRHRNVPMYHCTITKIDFVP